MVRADRTLGGSYQFVGKLVADSVVTGVNELGQATRTFAGELTGGLAALEQRGGQRARQVTDEAGQLGEAEVDEAVQAIDLLLRLRHELVAQPHQLAQLLRGLVGDGDGRRTLLAKKACDADSVDGVGLGALQVLFGEAARAQWIDEHDAEALADEEGEEVLPVVTGGLHGDQDVFGGAQRLAQTLVTVGILGETQRAQQDLFVLVDDRSDVMFGSNVDSAVAHGSPGQRNSSGASEPMLSPTLVHARTLASPEAAGYRSGSKHRSRAPIS